MSIAVLQEVFQETKRLSIAGSRLAVGDFRLQKLLPALAAAGKKAPVFAKVEQSVRALVESDEQQSAVALLDLSTLVLSILYTQGQTGGVGDVSEIQSKDIPLPTTQMSARVLKPLIEALTSTGAGRLETIREAHQRQLFQDLRLVSPTLKALDDPYPEIADYVCQHVLPTFGKAIVPEIVDNIDIKGKAGHARRLRLLHALAPALARPQVLDAFENGSKEMKVAALACLGDSPADLPHILEQAASKNKEVRQVAYSRLGRFVDDAAVDLLIHSLGTKNLELAIRAISQNPSPRLWEQVFAASDQALQNARSTTDKTQRSQSLAHLGQLLTCFHQRRDPATLAKLNQYYEHLLQIKKLNGTPVSGEDIAEDLADLALHSGDHGLWKKLIQQRDDLPIDAFHTAFAAAILSLPATETYDLFAGYLKDKKRSQWVKGVMMRDLLTMNWKGLHGSCVMITPEVREAIDKVEWDDRWLDAAIAEGDLECVMRFADPTHSGLKRFLLDRLQSSSKQRDFDYEQFRIISACLQMEYPEAEDELVAVLKSQSNKTARYHYYYWLSRTIALLPPAAIAKIEKVLPELSEKLIDEIMPALQELRSKSNAASAS